IVVGYTGGNGGYVSGFHGTNYFLHDIWIVKLTNAGLIDWQKCLGGTITDEAAAVHQTPDGGYIVGGFSGSWDGDAIGNS
ncbi:hypothetical protein, partial [Rhizobium leguminosarum]|uniref:hypothetical protein n=1 Tax=Rhizobium leguminosarum TaxID=384 RepID=UPI003F94BF75